MIWLVVFCIWV